MQATQHHNTRFHRHLDKNGTCLNKTKRLYLTIVVRCQRRKVNKRRSLFVDDRFSPNKINKTMRTTIFKKRGPPMMIKVVPCMPWIQTCSLLLCTNGDTTWCHTFSRKGLNSAIILPWPRCFTASAAPRGKLSMKRLPSICPQRRPTDYTRTQLLMQ